MAVYGVVMNQAVSMHSLGDNALATGYKTGEMLYSCSAIIFSNPKKGAAALYHFPAGDIYDDDASRALIESIGSAVDPTAAHVAYGTVEEATEFMKDLLDESPQPVKAKSKPHKTTRELVEYLQGILGGISVSASPAVGGSALVKIVDGVVQYDRIESGADVTDLSGHFSGTYPEKGYRIYWRRQFA